MTERDHVRFGDTTIEYEVRRSSRRRKTVQITVDGGGVRVAAPMRTPDRELQAIVRKRAAWILSHASGAMLEAAPKRFVSGETLPYLGRNVRMIVDSADMRSPEVRFDHWRFRVAVPQSLDGGERYESIRRAVVGWYRGRAAERLAASVDRWWPRLGRGEKSRVLVRDQRQRWGSCSPDGTLRFNWHAMMLEPALIGVHSRPRAGPPDPSEPLDGLLGLGVQGDAGRAATPPAAAGGRARPSPVTWR